MGTQVKKSSPLTVGAFACRKMSVVGVAAIVATAAALVLPIPVAIAIAVLLLLLCLLPPLRRVWWALLAAAVFLLSAVGRGTLQEQRLLPLDGQTAVITARVVDLPTNGQMYTVSVLGSDSVPVGARLSLYYVPGSEPLLYDTVTATVLLKKADTTYRRSEQVFLYAFPQGEWDASATVTDGAPAPLTHRISQRFGNILKQTLPGEEGELLAALCLGQRQNVTEAVTDAFRNSGLSHLLVVSGLHLSMLAVALRGLLRRVGVGYRLSAVAVLPVIWLFAGMVGGTSSVLRAATMCSLWLMSFVVYRRYDGLSAWGLAAALLLAADPYRLLNAGFQLSFAAVAGVLILAPRLCRATAEQPMPERPVARLWAGIVRFVRNGCGVCIGAMLFTLPLSVYYFGGLSLTVLPANLLAVVPAGWALTLGWLGLVCCSVPLLGWAGKPLLFAAGWLARYLERVARLLGPDGAFLPLPHTWQKLLIAALCGIAIAGILWRIPWKRVAVALGALTVCVCAVGMPLTHLSPRLTVITRGNHGGVLMQQGGHAALLADDGCILGDMPYYLEQNGVRRLEYLFIDSGEPANAAALSQLWLTYGQPEVYVANEEDWYSHTVVPVCYSLPDDLWELWAGASLSHKTTGWWQITMKHGEVLVCTNAALSPPHAATVTVYTALPRILPTKGYCILSCDRDAVPDLPAEGHYCVLTYETLTLTVRRDGEWSVLPWL